MPVFSGAPWDLRQRGAQDSTRHDKRLEKALKDNLKELISQESIIMSDGTKKVTIPIRYLEQYRFKYGQPQPDAGQGPGGVGDILWRPGQPGQPGEPGDEPGEHSYEAEVDLDTLTRLMLDDLALPWLEAKPAARQLTAPDYQWTDIRKKGMPGNMDKRRTLKANALRNAARKDPGIHDFTEDDLRYRLWDVHQTAVTQAVVYCLMDWSGSMTTDKKYVVKAFFFWLIRFLRLKYQHVELVFIAHDTQAEMVTEADFFGRSEGGGTRCSSAYKVAHTHMQAHYPAARWNVYVFHFSDGENDTQDDALCKTLVESMLHDCQQVGYGEIRWTGAWAPASTLATVLQTVQHPRFLVTVLRTKEDIHQALRAFLGQETLAVSPT